MDKIDTSQSQSLQQVLATQGADPIKSESIQEPAQVQNNDDQVTISAEAKKLLSDEATLSSGGNLPIDPN